MSARLVALRRGRTRRPCGCYASHGAWSRVRASSCACGKPEPMPPTPAHSRGRRHPHGPVLLYRVTSPLLHRVKHTTSPNPGGYDIEYTMYGAPLASALAVPALRVPPPMVRPPTRAAASMALRVRSMRHPYVVRRGVGSTSPAP